MVCTRFRLVIDCKGTQGWVVVQTRGSAVNEATAIPELVIVEAVRISDSGGEAM